MDELFFFFFKRTFCFLHTILLTVHLFLENKCINKTRVQFKKCVQFNFKCKFIKTVRKKEYACVLVKQACEIEIKWGGKQINCTCISNTGMRFIKVKVQNKTGFSFKKLNTFMSPPVLRTFWSCLHVTFLFCNKEESHSKKIMYKAREVTMFLMFFLNVCFLFHAHFL